MIEGRLNLRIDKELIEWAKGYCAQHHMTLSTFIRMLLVIERKREEESIHIDAEQI
jgi:antitoxin component of RelBE/YafQ-DinJ toxin-antitoxin module